MYNAGMARWRTVTVTNAEGARHSIDVRSESTFDAAHLNVATAKSKQAAMLRSRIPVPTVTTVFEPSSADAAFASAAFVTATRKCRGPNRRSALPQDAHRHGSGTPKTKARFLTPFGMTGWVVLFPMTMGLFPMMVGWLSEE